MNDASAIDYRALLRVLEDLGDDAPEVFAELTEVFLSDTPQLIEHLRNAAARQDFDAARRVAHRLKGGSAQLAAAALAAAAEQAEAFAGQLDQSLLQRTVERIQSDWRRLETELASLRTAARQNCGQGFLDTLRSRLS